MSYDLYRYIFIGGLVLSIVMLIVTVLLYFLLNIKSAIGDITGSNKRKAIENILSDNATEKPKKVQVKYDHEKASKSARLEAETMNTTKINAQDRFDNLEAGETAMLSEPSSDTTVLSREAETSVLNTGSSDTTVLNQGGSETTVLSSANETTVLSSANETTVLNTSERVADPDFTIEIDITYVHSNEVIR